MFNRNSDGGWGRTGGPQIIGTGIFYPQIFADFFGAIAADFPIPAPCQVVLAMQSKNSVTGYNALSV